MIKGFEALENIIETFYDKDSEDIQIVKETLKALEIIISKRVDMLCFLMSKSREQYNEESCSDMYLTMEEYNFLKEVLQ